MNIIQTPKEVAFVVGRVRHIWMNVPHSANPKPSWYGESVGHYEGETLVVDTIEPDPKQTPEKVGDFDLPHDSFWILLASIRVLSRRLARALKSWALISSQTYRTDHQDRPRRLPHAAYRQAPHRRALAAGR